MGSTVPGLLLPTPPPSRISPIGPDGSESHLFSEGLAETDIHQSLIKREDSHSSPSLIPVGPEELGVGGVP